MYQWRLVNLKTGVFQKEIENQTIQENHTKQVNQIHQMYQWRLLTQAEKMYQYILVNLRNQMSLFS